MTTEATAETLDPNALAEQTQPEAQAEAPDQDTQTQETPEQSRPHGNKGQQPWYMKRIADESHAKDQARAEVQAERQRAQAAEEMLARMQRAPTEQPRPQPTQQQPSRDQYASDVRAEADNLRFYENVQNLKQSGFSVFPDFAQSIEVLGAVGLGNPAVLADLMGVDLTNAHVILDTLAKDLMSDDPTKQARAAAFADMDPRRRIAEFTRMSDAVKPKAQTPTIVPVTPAAKVSKAPPPAPRIEATTSTVKDWRQDEASDADFDVGFNDMLKKRNARR